MKKLLAIDDSPNMLFYLTKMLDNHFEVTPACDGKEGLQLAQKKQFDAFICDINMPNMNGYDFIRHIRKIKHYETTPFIFLTSEKNTENIEIGKSLGATGWIIKPIKPEKLLGLILKIFDS